MNERYARALCALEGLSVGDAFGDQFFLPQKRMDGMFENRTPPVAPWYFTDDTNMALSVVQILGRRGSVQVDELAESFAVRYEPDRGYGPSMHRLLREIAEGKPWQEAAQTQFGNQG